MALVPAISLAVQPSAGGVRLFTLRGGVAFLLLGIPLMALSGAVRRQDMIALDGYLRSVGAVSPLFWIVL
ncbi:MAG: hypothetical protein ABSG92_05470 [Conexivisphaerales archaeon]